MTLPAVELLRTLYSAGAKVRIEDDQLWVKAKPGVITDDLKKAIAERKPELVELLTTYPCGRCGWGVYSEPTICFHCRKAIALEKARAEIEGLQNVTKAAETDLPKPENAL